MTEAYTLMKESDKTLNQQIININLDVYIDEKQAKIESK
tara:strand:- start:896 stop:1012 length:117 start_codon:yes stop_codon:yes gene_type:complete